MLVDDIIKIKYSNEGYLFNYPPHLISDEEMCYAFLYNEISYFEDNYQLVSSSLKSEYNTLILAIKYHIFRFLTSVPAYKKDLPDWVYSYMLGETISEHSSLLDKHYWLVGINRDNIDDIITEESQNQTYLWSSRYVSKLNRFKRFVNIESDIKSFTEDEIEVIHKELEKFGVTSTSIDTRPPTMFGEPHIIKMIRLQEVF